VSANGSTVDGDVVVSRESSTLAEPHDHRGLRTDLSATQERVDACEQLARA